MPLRIACTTILTTRQTATKNGIQLKKDVARLKNITRSLYDEERKQLRAGSIPAGRAISFTFKNTIKWKSTII